MRRFAVILILLLSAGVDARSGPGMTGPGVTGPAMRFVNYGSAGGLPSNTVYAVAQDAAGILWIGTRNGLASFDGRRIQAFKEYGRVNALAVDRGGRLWVGTSKGLRVMPDQVGHDEGKVGRDGNIRALHADAAGYVWATVGDTLLLKLSYDDGIKEAVESLLSSLDKRRRDLICQRYGIGCEPVTRREMSEARGISVKNLDYRIKKSIDKLRDTPGSSSLRVYL